ncbi:MAG: CDP-alcohol phosphatidyltransferase family protein [Flavobacteriaceae bacterium]|nr:CDP-alcohol phosphatidyltransferase family protein [Flavobacteriaceae bacterium]
MHEIQVIMESKMGLTFKNFNIADWFSFYRIIAAPFLLILIWLDHRLLFTWFLLISYCTDMIDGYLARKFKISSIRGSQLDSVGDQLTFGVGLIGVWVFERDFVIENSFWILLGLSLYVLQMVIAFLKYGKTTSFHTYLAKLSAILQGAFIIWILFFGDASDPVFWLFYIMIFFGVIETIEEIALIFLYDDWVAGVKGIYWAINDKRRRA